MDKQMQDPEFIGVDVAKDTVVVARHGHDQTRSLANAAAALRAWIKSLPAHAHIGVESTGGYHELLARLAHGAGLTVYVLNPKDVSHYGHALGRRAKTDRVDALLLARYAQRVVLLEQAAAPSASPALQAAAREVANLEIRTGQTLAAVKGHLAVTSVDVRDVAGGSKIGRAHV